MSAVQRGLSALTRCCPRSRRGLSANPLSPTDLTVSIVLVQWTSRDLGFAYKTRMRPGYPELMCRADSLVW